MPEFKKIQSAQDMRNAIAQRNRMGLKKVGLPTVSVKRDDYKTFLESYVFNRMGTTPSSLIGNLETQYYAEQNFRDRRQRNIDFTRGRQFNEAVWDSDLKRWVTQWEYLRRRNIPPLTYNVVSKLVRSLTGQFREINTGNVVKCDAKDDRGTELATMLTTCLERIKSNNKSKAKDAMSFKEHLLSGHPVNKVMWGTKMNSETPDIKYRTVNPAKFIVNPGLVDYDLENYYRSVEIHDTSLDDIITMFSNDNYDLGMEIKQAYIKYQGNEINQSTFSNSSFSGNQIRNNTFYTQGINNSSYRYYEVWQRISDFEATTFDPLDGIGTYTAHKWENVSKVKRMVEEENESRRQNAAGIDSSEDYLIQFKTKFVSRWYVIFLTPWGYVLDVRESPYKNGMNPYVFPPPDINGEVWGLVEEVLNAQLSLDRQIQLADAIVANASKGVWLIPDTAVPDDYTNKQYISELKRTDGAIIYKVRDGVENIKPEQQFANAANVAGNVQQLIQLYSSLVDEISGNYGAAQGKNTSSGTTATGYALESQNAGLNIRDTMENFLSMLVDRDELILKFILEGYTRSDFRRITGQDIDPRELKGFSFYIEQSKGTNSPAHRLALEQELMQLVYAQLMPFDVFLDISNNPVMVQAKQKLEEWKKKQAELQQQQMGLNAANQIPQGNMAAPQIGVPQSSVLSMQGHPQGQLLAEQPVEQELPKLPGLG